MSRNRPSLYHHHHHRGTTTPPATTSSSGGSSSSSNGGSGHHGHEMAEVRRGLGRCVGLLVAVMMRGGESGEEGGLGVAGGGVEPVLMRALCEVVRCAEEGVLV